MKRDDILFNARLLAGRFQADGRDVDAIRVDLVAHQYGHGYCRGCLWCVQGALALGSFNGLRRWSRRFLKETVWVEDMSNDHINFDYGNVNA